jgi:3-hydroxyisobutyrate dehydrogenase-like beta-hydroxyacid dehydrogenase
MQVGFVGLGKLGKPMAANILAGGFDLTVFNRSQSRIDDLCALGATAGSSPAEIASEVDTIHTCLANVEAVESMITGPSGVLEGAKPGLILVDHSTVDPGTSRRIGALAQAQGVRFLDAPVSVTGDIALRESITMMVGGDEDDFELVLPVLNAAARLVRLMGPVSSGSTTKLINNMILGSNKVIAMESAVLGTKAGLDPTALYEIVQNASGASLVWTRDVKKFLTRTFKAQGAVRLLGRDMDLARELAADMELTLPVLNAAVDFWVRARESGMSEEDPTSAVLIYEKAAGIQVVANPDPN